MSDDDDLDALPADPDRDHIPEPLSQYEGEQVTIRGRDTETGEEVELSGVLALSAGVFGEAARLRSGYYNDVEPPDDELDHRELFGEEDDDG